MKLEEKSLTFLYNVEKGKCPTQRSYARNVAKLAGIEPFILNEASEKANTYEQSMDEKKFLKKENFEKCFTILKKSQQ